MPYNKGDFTQQGIAGDVTSLVRLNEKRTVKLTLSADDAGDNCDISGSVIDELNGKTYPIGAGVSGNIEITENGENINVAPYATATVNVSGGGGFPTCEITLVPHAGGSKFTGYNEEGANFCLDSNGKLMASIASYQTNLVVNGLYSEIGGTTYVTYNNMNEYGSEAEAIASVTNAVNLTVVAYDVGSGIYYASIMPTDDSLPSSCTMTGDGK